MADDATISITATLLPDEISKSISGSMTVTPDDANDKWYLYNDTRVGPVNNLNKLKSPYAYCFFYRKKK